ncbi:hypothetical protein ACIGZJ_36085 [Kitasatospora sp. NPDC052868]|uniref:hypothetical protein n=1 Tax=Kitasatospora sp. NPDC052868 TaxID=3364060 RepID=UPI0037CA918C
MTDKTKLTASITVQQAGRLALRSKRYRKEQSEYLEELRKEGLTQREARLEMARVRAEWWPPLEEVVAAALDLRLAEPDLAGPWPELTEEEELGMALSGRWPGPALPARLCQRNYLVPTDLVRRLRTASWRVSAEPLALLGDGGLVRVSHLPGNLQAERERLADLVHSPGRIVRQALDRYSIVEPNE